MDFDLYKDVPIYQRLWRNGAHPILEKSDISTDFPHSWITPSIRTALEQGDVEWVSSSGTTTERMQIMRPANWRAEQLHKTFMQHPVLRACWDEHITRVSLTTAVCSQTACYKEDPGPEKRKLGRTLYINLSSDPQAWYKSDIERMLKEIAAYSPYFFDADPCYLALFLKKINQYQLHHAFVTPQAVTLGYELVTQNIKHYISELLDAPIINLYGSTELGYILMEKAPGTLSLCSEDTHLEFLPLNPELSLYSLIVSTSKNPYMPLIRYRSGDCVQQNNEHHITRLCGRESESIKAFNGSLIPHAVFDDLVSECAPSIMLYQLQKRSQNYMLHYTTFNDLTLNEYVSQCLEKRIAELLGQTCTTLYRQTISPSISGKFKWLIVSEH
jgi:phenylacetate-CoA ligase